MKISIYILLVVIVSFLLSPYLDGKEEEAGILLRFKFNEGDLLKYSIESISEAKSTIGIKEDTWRDTFLYEISMLVGKVTKVGDKTVYSLVVNCNKGSVESGFLDKQQLSNIEFPISPGGYMFSFDIDEIGKTFNYSGAPQLQGRLKFDNITPLFPEGNISSGSKWIQDVKITLPGTQNSYTGMDIEKILNIDNELIGIEERNGYKCAHIVAKLNTFFEELKEEEDKSVKIKTEITSYKTTFFAIEQGFVVEEVVDLNQKITVFYKAPDEKEYSVNSKSEINNKTTQRLISINRAES